MGLLDNINEPNDIKQYDSEQWEPLASEIREFLIDHVSKTGGHLASNLGCVELTMALHLVLNLPDDKIIWDVGHQSYTHKILTGRKDGFDNLRQFGGMSGFPKRAESETDVFDTGHSSTSISAAIGMAKAKELKGEKSAIVAVIGDGSFTGGLTYEALNNLGRLKSSCMIVLNDNDMSIDRAVGGMEQYLINLDVNATYNKLRFRASQWLHGKGYLNDDRRKGIIRLNNALKSALTHQQNIFEGLNIRYFGPFDGNDVKNLVHVLRQIKDMRGPKLLHLHTVKGKGYAPAEKNATVWHAPGKFDVATGQRIAEGTAQQPLKYQEVFGKTLLELAKQNPRIVGVTPAMPTGCSMNIMMKEMPDRVFDVGIAEGHAVTFSGGMAKDGLQPFCNIYSAFAQRAYDNIIHDLAILNLPVVLCLDRAGLVGQDGPTHHGAFDMAALRPVPNLSIASPMDEHELRRLMYTAQLPGKGTFVIRYPRGRGVLPAEKWSCPFEEIEVGTGRKLHDGKELAVITIGPIGNDVETVIKQIETDNSNSVGKIAHYDLRFLKPLDGHLLTEVGERFKKVITVEDGVRNGGMGSAVLEWMADKGYTPMVVRLGLPDKFVEHGTVEEERRVCGIDNESLRKDIEALL